MGKILQRKLSSCGKLNDKWAFGLVDPLVEVRNSQGLCEDWGERPGWRSCFQNGTGPLSSHLWGPYSELVLVQLWRAGS